MASFGSASPGKSERRKEVGLLAMMHSEVFVSQTITSDANHFYRSIMAANSYPGPALVSVYSTCLPEHGDGGAPGSPRQRHPSFPSLHLRPPGGRNDKRAAEFKRESGDERGLAPRFQTREPLDFIEFARTEGRFSRQFDADGNPSERLLLARDERLTNWHRLQELAGIR
jgi:pyruvate-ferredoxin/flavodoxin oxidoreductase